MKGDYESIISYGSSGIVFIDEELIIVYLDNFCNYICSMIDVIYILLQFFKFVSEVQNLFCVIGDVIINSYDVEDDQVVSEMYFKMDVGGFRFVGVVVFIGSGFDYSYLGIMFMKNKIDIIIVYLYFL